MWYRCDIDVRFYSNSGDVVDTFKLQPSLIMTFSTIPINLEISRGSFDKVVYWYFEYEMFLLSMPIKNHLRGAKMKKITQIIAAPTVSNHNFFYRINLFTLNHRLIQFVSVISLVYISEKRFSSKCIIINILELFQIVKTWKV